MQNGITIFNRTDQYINITKYSYGRHTEAHREREEENRNTSSKNKISKNKSSKNKINRHRIEQAFEE